MLWTNYTISPQTYIQEVIVYTLHFLKSCPFLSSYLSAISPVGKFATLTLFLVRFLLRLAVFIPSVVALFAFVSIYGEKPGFPESALLLPFFNLVFQVLFEWLGEKRLIAFFRNVFDNRYRRVPDTGANPPAEYS